MKNDFVHLHVHSTYSLMDSVATIPKLVARAKELGMSALALTDHGNMFGIKEFYDACVRDRGEKAIKPILGCEVYVTSSDDHTKRDKDEKRYHLCLYAKNKTGYQNLMRLVSVAHREGFYFRPRIDRALLERYHEGLACTSACIAGEVASCMDRGESAKAEEAARWYKNLFGEDYCLEVMLHPAIRRHPAIPKDAEIEHLDMFQRRVGWALRSGRDAVRSGWVLIALSVTKFDIIHIEMKRVVERFLNALAGSATLSPIVRRLVLPASHADDVRPRVRRAALPSVALLARGNVSMALAYADSEADYQEKKERVLAYDFKSFSR